MARWNWAKKWAPYRSGLEASVAASLKEQKIEFGYECETIEYRKRVVKGVCDACGGNKTSQRCTYKPDFVLRGSEKSEQGVDNKDRRSIYIEVKGHFSPSDRAKMVAVKQDNPGLDIRLIFGANNKLKKNNEKRYSDWADEHGFPYHVGNTFPSEWVRGTSEGVQTRPSPTSSSDRSKTGSLRKYKRGKYIRQKG